jgi:hypothetical protein
MTLACLVVAAVKAYPEKTVQASLQVIGGEADYIVFNDLIVLRDATYIAGCSGTFENHVYTLWKIDVEDRLVSSITGVKGYFVSLSSDGSTIYAAGLLEHDAPPKTTGYLAAFDPDLSKLWGVEWRGSSLFSWFRSVVVQADGIYVAGAVQYPGEEATDIVLHKYNKTGYLLWEKTFSLKGHQTPESMVCYNGRIYIASTTAPLGSSENVDGLLIVTDMNGSEVYRATWGGDGKDFFSSVEVGDGVYICGFTDSYGAGGYDGLLLKMDFSGKVVWWRTFGGPGDDSFIDLCLDEDSVHVVGHVTGSAGTIPLYVKYGVDGTLLGNWTLPLGALSSWSGVHAAAGVTRMVGSSMVGAKASKGVYARYTTIYRLTVNLPEEDFWASLDGENKTGRSVSFDAAGGEHKLEATLCKTAGKSRYTFSFWSDGVVDNPRAIKLKKDAEINAIYKVEHLVEASSPIGEVSGGGWYVEGSTATVSVRPSIIPRDFFTYYVFDGWIENGTKASASSTYTFTVTKPTRLTASWRAEPNPITVGLIILILVIIIIVLLALTIKIGTKRKKSQPPPPDQA